MSQSIVNEKNYIAARYAFQYQNLTASYLRLETLLGTQGQITFNVQTNLPNTVASEQRLNQTDQFVITHIGFAIKKIASATPAASDQAVAKLYTWVNSNTGLFDGSNDANIQAIYNGYLEINVNRKIWMPAIDMRSFERVPDAQQGQPLAAIAGPVTYALKRDGFPNGLYGFFPVDYIRLNGYSLIQPQITLPASVAMAEANESNYAVLMFKGYLAQNEGNSKEIA